MPHGLCNVVLDDKTKLQYLRSSENCSIKYRPTWRSKTDFVERKIKYKKKNILLKATCCIFVFKQNSEFFLKEKHIFWYQLCYKKISVATISKFTSRSLNWHWVKTDYCTGHVWMQQQYSNDFFSHDIDEPRWCGTIICKSTFCLFFGLFRRYLWF